ncbi:GspE/PulE family protein [Gulbenkiania mobilis]|uniref:GspE/PulE family protein n=1 Tax=Gulbenkiania mobilis TaxID=397457 RepID=UPI0013791B95|nr:ATPase, T2SS/T4P/T4SS family [Gulbenkiania mobilis]
MNMKDKTDHQIITPDEAIIESIDETLRQHVCISTCKHLLITEEKLKENRLAFSNTIQNLKKGDHILGYRIISMEEMMRLQDSVESLRQITTADHSDMQKEVLKIIDDAIACSASDIHFVKKDQRTLVLFRCLGDLDPETSPRLSQTADWGMSAMRCIYQSMTDVSGTQFSTSEPQDASMDRNRLPPSLFGARIATTPIFSGHYMVIRLLYKGATTKTLAELGYTKAHIHCLEYALRNPSGIVLIAGVTGSGKTTTLATALNKVYDASEGKVNIVTVEDPVEFILPARQIAVTAEGDDARKAAYGRAVKATMRLDPDVCMISELRDETTIMQAIQLALTGHQVFSTVHALDTTSILPRLEMYGIPREVLADNKLITALVAQTLVKKLCPACKISHEDAIEIKAIEERYVRHLNGVIDTDKVKYKGAGCSQCNHTGYSGRTVLAEVVLPDAKYMQHYRDGNRIAMRDHAFTHCGWISRHEHARNLVQDGVIDPRDAEAAIGPLTADRIESDHTITQSEIMGMWG